MAALSFIAAGSILACDGPTFVPENPTVSAFAIAVDPDPVEAQASTDPAYSFMISFTADLTESAGVGATFDSTTVTVTELVDGDAVGGVEEEQFKMEVGIELDRIEGNERIEIPIEVFYTLPEGGTEANIDISLFMTDDNGYQVGGTLRVSVP
jgi:hypothetical protein